MNFFENCQLTKTADSYTLTVMGETVTLTAEQSAKLLMPLDMAERLDWAGIMSIEPNGADMATVTVRYGSEHWLFCQVIAAGGAIRILDDPASAKRLCDMAKSLICPL